MNTRQDTVRRLLTMVVTPDFRLLFLASFYSPLGYLRSIWQGVYDHDNDRSTPIDRSPVSRTPASTAPAPQPDAQAKSAALETGALVAKKTTPPVTGTIDGREQESMVPKLALNAWSFQDRYHTDASGHPTVLVRPTKVEA